MLFQTDRFTLLDGGMGTMLQAHGLKPGALPPLMSLTAADTVAQIHRAYAEAGSDIIYANTFGLSAKKLRGTGHRLNEVVLAAVRAARKGAGDRVAVALDIGPLGALMAPLGTMTFTEAYAAFAELAVAGEQAGADLAVIETMTDLQEARAALLAVKENSRLPVLVTMSFEENGRTFTGCTPEAMARTLTGLGADAVGVNCSLGPRELMPIVREIVQATPLPVIAKPNAGLPDPVDGHYDLSPEDFAQAMLQLAEAGASILGGCCGTSPAYIAALKACLTGRRPERAAYVPVSAVCSASDTVRIDRARIIGERLNPTGKKRFQQALSEGDFDYLAGVAVQEQDAGAEILDVNVGMPGVAEAEALPRAVMTVQAAVPLPLQLDSTNPQALEAALRIYCGKAAVNSVNAGEDSLKTILPLVRKYGAAVVGLAMDDHGLPESAQDRLRHARRILEAALALGIPREDVWIDCLTLTVSAAQAQAEETLTAVRRVRGELGLQTVLGVSNISFGLPNRPGLSAAFLLRALDHGLTLPIINPNAREMADAMAAWRALNGEDEACAAWVERFADMPAGSPAALPAKKAAPRAVDTLEEAIRRGLRAEAEALAPAAIAAHGGMGVVEQVLIPALDAVGQDYEAGRAFLPQLLGAAQAAQAVFQVLRETMPAASARARGTLLLATVRGDIHDIGKNIVKTVLENYGYQVIDLGRDVPVETIVAETRQRGIRLVGLSALMTTTLPAMAETVAALKALPEPPEILIGGAVVTRAYADGLGVRYARDAREAALQATEVLG